MTLGNELNATTNIEGKVNISTGLFQNDITIGNTLSKITLNSNVIATQIDTTSTGGLNLETNLLARNVNIGNSLASLNVNGVNINIGTDNYLNTINIGNGLSVINWNGIVNTGDLFGFRQVDGFISQF